MMAPAPPSAVTDGAHWVLPLFVIARPLAVQNGAPVAVMRCAKMSQLPFARVSDQARMAPFAPSEVIVRCCRLPDDMTQTGTPFWDQRADPDPLNRWQ